MSCIATAILTGRLTADPELKTTPNGKFVTSFNIAVERGYGERKKILFPTLVAWNGQAEFVCILPKGTMIAATCEMDERSWEKDGKKHKVTEFIIREVQALESKKASASGASTPNDTSPSYAPSDNNFEDLSDDDELPF